MLLFYNSQGVASVNTLFSILQLLILFSQNKAYFMRLLQIFFSYGFFYLVSSSNVACGEQYCQQCGYDRIQDDNGHFYIDDYQSCITCSYSWFPDNRICHKNTCTWQCTQCDFTGKYCITCNSKYYDFSVYGCKLSSTIIITIVTISIIAPVFVIFAVFYCCYLRKKKLMLRHRQNRNNVRLTTSQRSHTHTEKNNFSEKKDSRGIIDYKNICSICLEDNCQVILRCSHLFHTPCIYIWLTNKNSCPNCNLQIINIVKILTCLKCRAKTKQYDLLRSNRDIIYKIQHSICNDCQFKFRPIDTQMDINQN